MSQITDVRLRTNFFTDIRTRRLIKACGDAGVIAFQKMWIYAAEHFPTDGQLKGLSSNEVEEEIGVQDSSLLAVLEDIGYIKKTVEGWIKIVDWQTDQSWAAGALERREKARKAAEKRWESSPSVPAGKNDDLPF